MKEALESAKWHKQQIGTKFGNMRQQLHRKNHYDRQSEQSVQCWCLDVWDECACLKCWMLGVWSIGDSVAGWCGDSRLSAVIFVACCLR